ncbi:MAG: AF1514 family protein [Archaeoglobaceae archaeon]|nr:AF1514 family protein [Archaeoglobaceae archaeon]HDD36647.1 hypothetical protein [Archaeoglobus veneficus]
MKVDVKLDFDVEFEKALDVAKSIASNFGDAMLLSWRDLKTGKKYPNVDCCGEDSWEIYAINRGGNLKINVNEYSFIFRV